MLVYINKYWFNLLLYTANVIAKVSIINNKKNHLCYF